ncbi:MAG: hypothetical protein AAGG75_27670 [Bacteroidota bacterium]
MYIRILIILLAVAFVYILFRLFMHQPSSKICQRCAGRGYWTGTRGEKNHCKPCRGTGEMALR